MPQFFAAVVSFFAVTVSVSATYAAVATALAAAWNAAVVGFVLGRIGKALAGMAAVPGAVLALDPENNTLHRYQRGAEGWQAQSVLPMGKLNEPEGLSVRTVAGGLELLVRDDDGLQHGQLHGLCRSRSSCRQGPGIGPS